MSPPHVAAVAQVPAPPPPTPDVFPPHARHEASAATASVFPHMRRDSTGASDRLSRLCPSGPRTRMARHAGIASPARGIAILGAGIASPGRGIAILGAGIAILGAGIASPGRGIAILYAGIASPGRGIAILYAGIAS